MVGFFPIYFKQYFSYGIDPATSTAWLGLGNSAASLVVFVLAPLLGALADAGNMKKRLLLCFACIGMGMTAALAFVDKGQAHVAIAIYGASVVGFLGANVLYDSLLSAVARPRHYQRVSSLGYALGYLGGGLLFLFCVLLVTMPQTFGLDSAATAIKAAFLLTALWWLVFSLPLMLFVKEPRYNQALLAHEDSDAGERSPRSVLVRGFMELSGTLRKIRKLPVVLLFLLAYWFYIDGVQTVAVMAVDFGLNIGLESNDLITALLVIQFLAFPCTLLAYGLAARFGVKPVLYILIGVYLVVTVAASGMTTSNEFYLLAVFIALAQGGLQALSRALYARITPARYAGEFFGFYNMFGKFAAMLGPLIVSASALLMDDIRFSVWPIALLFLIGACLLMRVNIKQGEADAKAFRL